MIGILNTILEAFQIYPEKKNRLPGIITIIISSNLIQLVIPIMVMKVLDGLRGKADIEITSLILLMISWLVAILIVSLIDHRERFLLKEYDNITINIFHSKIIQLISRISFLTWINKNSKENADEIKKDLEDLTSLLPSTIIPLFRNIIMAFITFIILSIINWKLTLVISLLVPAYLIAFIFWDKKTKINYRKYRNLSEKYLSNLVEYIQTIPTMLLFSTFFTEQKKISSLFNLYVQKNFNYFKIVNQRRTYSYFLTSFSPIYLAFCALIFVRLNLATIGEIFAFWGVFSLNIRSINGASGSYVKIIHSCTIFNKIFNENENYRNNFKTITHEINCIEGRNVIFSYGITESKKIMFPDFNINKGETIRIHGLSGVGKTTLFKILLGLYKLESGEIKINGIDINDIDFENIRKQIGYVEQNGYLYSRTLRENIILGRAYDATKWNRTIKISRLNNFISNLENRENSLLGENGIKISGGEKQRILIARAIYDDPSWFFLDEPFTGIDDENQVEIRKILVSLKNIKTILIISHQENLGLHFSQNISIN